VVDENIIQKNVGWVMGSKRPDMTGHFQEEIRKSGVGRSEGDGLVA